MADLLAHLSVITVLTVLSVGGILLGGPLPVVLKAARGVRSRRPISERDTIPAMPIRADDGGGAASIAQPEN